MMTLEAKLKGLKIKNKLGLMTHVVVGYPTLDDTVALVRLMARQGVDIIELQIPFSDPLADGPTIMKACEIALSNGIKVKDSFNIAKQLSQEVSIPLFFMAYYNTVFKYGTEKFCRDAKDVGISGLIVPDMPIEEENEERFLLFCRKYNLYNIHVISPASTKDRLRKNADVADGFIYCTARQGITGVKDKLDPNLSSYLRKLRRFFSIPIAVGFGISKRQHLEALSSYADIAVVGSAIIDVINASGKNEIETNIIHFLNGLKV